MSEMQQHEGGVDQAPQVGHTVHEVTPEDMQYIDFWGSTETYRYFLKDGKQYFEIKPMNEGAKAQFQKKTNRGFRMNQRSNEARMDVDPAGDRHTLIKESVVGWRIMQRGPDGTFSEYPFAPRNLDVVLEKFDPKVIQDLEFFIRTKNPWMQGDLDVEDLEKQRDELDVLIKQAKEEQAGEGSSSSK
jgi:hypothetical protein